MHSEFEKIEKARNVLEKIAKGVNPLTGESIEDESLLNDPRMIRCFYFVSEVLDNVLKGTYSNQDNKQLSFSITPEQKNKVQFPAGKIGVNEFSKCVNACINPGISKKLTGVELNRKLKKIGLLSEEPTEQGKTRTSLCDKSAQFGFELERKSYNGIAYDMVVINELGKKYLLDNIESIMEIAN